MISVRCPACGKVIGFEETDAGSLVACPHCRQAFFVPMIAQPVTAGAEPDPPVAPKLPQEPALPDLDDIRIAPDPDLDPIPEQFDEVQPVDEPAPPSEPEPAPPAAPDPIPHLELDSPMLEEIETVEPIGVAKEVEPTDLAPSLSAAAVLSQSLPEKTEPDRPAEVLEEVADEEDDRFENKDEESDEEEEEERPKRRKSKNRKPYHAQPSLPEGVTRNRILGGVATGMGSMMLLGTVAHHLIAAQNAWHWGVCCADLFALTMMGVGLYFLIKG